MAKRVADRADDEIIVGNQDADVQRIDAEPGEVVVVGGVGLQDNLQARISEAGSDEIPAHVVEAANKGRLARGDEPFVPGNVATKQDLFPAPKSAFGEMDGVGEDTQAVKQSQVPRLRDGHRISADEVHRENQDQ